VVLPLGAATLNFNGMLTLNQSGVLLWRALEKGCTQEELTEVLLAEYDVSRQEASADIGQFLNTLIQAGCLDAE
jgi:sensor domain CHASE-containing protein